ncbi:insulin-degrading enzyme [Caerostris extrusa]|uniref:Insulin-degrading enzyme n=1 Tax=Caerostris extrusa TaxID=172846 RepID=A0AAV4RJ23_CAEEX|nr:insulin-degrading enzyme [Caerostris extrusa]
MACSIFVGTVSRIIRKRSGSSRIYNLYFKLPVKIRTYSCSSMILKDKLVSKIYDDIIKSEQDARQYRGLELRNGMKVLLISDPSTDKSAAALDVQIGSMSEPREFPGLAHFCEHMLFLGTEKYPSENDYNKFLREHGGSSNAYTAEGNTCYYFDVSPNFLKEALDRFAQFFLCPLFTEKATEREVNAVDSEHEKNLQIDSWRLVQLEKATCNPQHDYSKFGTGNLETLSVQPKSRGINIRDELLKFHEKFYSANVMALTVFGKESLEELMDIVIPLFSKVANKNVEYPEWKEHPFDSDHLKLEGYVVPVKDIRTLNVSFPIPDLRQEYRSNPDSYLGHLIGHEGPGSLLSELKSLGWVNSLAAGAKPGCRGFAFFIVDFILTEDGLEHTDDIVTILFQYLTLLREVGPQEWVFQECKKLSEMNFRFKDKEKPQVYVYSVASRIFRYPINEVLSGPYLLHEYKPDLISKLLDLLTPDTIRIAKVGKEFENICHETEKWYGTKYRLDPIKEDILNQWKTVKLHPNLKLPLPNDLIASDFTLLPIDPENLNFLHLFVILR